MKRSPGVVVLVLLAAACGRREAPLRAAPVIVVADSGFATPESMQHDPLNDRYLVSNLGAGGSPFDADDNGFISVLSADGRVATLRWIDGASDSVTLNAPKGITFAGEFIFVTDIDVVRQFDRSTGAARGEFRIPGATFLNDIVAGPDGALYFTDSGLKPGPSGFEPSGTDAVYRLDPSGRLDVLARGAELGRPNGVAVTSDSVYVVGFGSGELYRVANGVKTDVVRPPQGGLDGLVIANGEAFLSSWDGRTVYRGPLQGPFRVLLPDLESPADLGHDLYRHQLLVPLFSRNQLRIIPLVPQ